MIIARSATLTKEPGKPPVGRIRLWSLREDVLVEADPDGERLLVITRWGETRIDGTDPVVRESLRRMSFGPISLDNVVPSARTGEPGEPGGSAASDGVGEWGKLHEVLKRLSGSVVHSLGLYDGEGPLLSAVPISRTAAFHLAEIGPAEPLRLSKFAAMRAFSGELLLESPLAEYQVLLHRELATRVVAALSTAVTVTELATTLDVAEPIVADIVAYLIASGIVLRGEWQGAPRSARFAEDEDPSLIRWSHHDLLFHSRSRLGRYGGPAGAVFPHADRLPSPPLVKPVPKGPRFDLYRPELPELVAGDPPLTAVIENARLCPELSDRPVTAEQIGELLFRAARIRSIAPASAGADVTYPVSDRPYLGINGLHELELYLSLNRCAGLPAGIYHYDPKDHALTLINDSETERGELLDHASVAAGTTRRPPVLITIAARVARASWMYGGIAYSLTLTHVGALQQTLCLVATAMGLAPCVPAIDPGDIADSALRLDWPAEIGVGEFILGYRLGPGNSIGSGL
jgi:SagB-type dehydrogenase family enzyme